MASTSTAVSQTVTDFWFDDAHTSQERLQTRYARWFKADPAFDTEIQRRFGKLVEAAAAGNLADWDVEATSRLALIILLDQFPRNLYRGTAEAFACDEQALALTMDGLGTGMEKLLRPLEQVFFCMPLQHSERPDIQDYSVAKFETLVHGDYPPFIVTALERCAEFARLHRDIIARFGRFPHRNAVLGRESTREEIEYLDDGGPSFGQ